MNLSVKAPPTHESSARARSPLRAGVGCGGEQRTVRATSCPRCRIGNPQIEDEEDDEGEQVPLGSING